jgi:hypothetical protein
MEGSVKCYESLLRQGANRLKGHERRLFMAEVTLKLWDGNPRIAERRFGWGRETVAKGLHELRQGVRCLENFSARGRPRMEDQNPQLAAGQGRLAFDPAAGDLSGQWPQQLGQPHAILEADD